MRGAGARRRRTLVLLVGTVVLAGCVQSSEEKVGSIYQLKADPNEENVAGIRGYLEDPSDYVRAAALFSIAELREPDAAMLAIAGLDDEAPFVRITAASVLGDLEDGAAVGPLLSRLRNDEDWHVRQRAAESLGKLGGQDALQGLVEALADPVNEVRAAAVEAVTKVDPGAAVDALGRIVRNDTEWEIRVKAVRALGVAGDPASRPDLEAALQDTSEFVRSAAAHAITLLDDSPGQAEDGGE
jgi:HEAT repeat protein